MPPYLSESSWRISLVVSTNILRASMVSFSSRVLRPQSGLIQNCSLDNFCNGRKILCLISSFVGIRGEWMS